MESVIHRPGELDEMAALYRAAWNDPDFRTVTEYGRDEVRDPGSAHSENYDPDTSPWNTEPLNCWHLKSPVRRIVYPKPVQIGGSKAGEVALCYSLEKAPSGDIGYFWPSNVKAGIRYEKRLKKILLASSVARYLPIRDKEAFKNRAIILPRLNFEMLGVESKGNTASDSIQWIIGEECHLWDEGKLQLVLGRASAFGKKNHRIFLISNASKHDDQFHRAFLEGTQQHWQVKCPGCGLFHAMRIRYDKKRPDLGGLYYDADGCRLDGGYYNYTRLKETLRYRFPCGYELHDDADERAALSRTGRYSEPTNSGALLTDRSFTLEAVAVHHIDWLQLVKDKHAALRAMRHGNLDPWITYIQERECGFFNKKEVPGSQRIELRSSDRRAGETAKAPESAMRFAFFDFQHGKGKRQQAPHFWGVVRDFWVADYRLKARLVWAGRIDTEAEVEEVRQAHNVDTKYTGVDSGHESTIVYRLCARFGYTAFKGMGTETGARRTFPHHETREIGDELQRVTVQRIFSEGEFVNAYQGDPHGGQRELLYVPLYKFCKQTIRDRLAWALESGEADFEIPLEVPGGVWGAPGEPLYADRPELTTTDVYSQHMQAEELITKKNGVDVWEDFGRDVDLKVGELGCLLQAEMAGLAGAHPDDETAKQDESTAETALST